MVSLLEIEPKEFSAEIVNANIASSGRLSTDIDGFSNSNDSILSIVDGPLTFSMYLNTG